MKMRDLLNKLQSIEEGLAPTDSGWEQMKSDPEGAQLLAKPRIFSQDQELVDRDLGNGQTQQLLKTSYIYSMTPTSTKHIVDVVSDANNTDQVVTSSYRKIPGATA